MRIKQDHRKADQSEGEAAGSKGSSYFTTVPRITPINSALERIFGAYGEDGSWIARSIANSLRESGYRSAVIGAIPLAFHG